MSVRTNYLLEIPTTTLLTTLPFLGVVAVKKQSHKIPSVTDRNPYVFPILLTDSAQILYSHSLVARFFGQ